MNPIRIGIVGLEFGVKVLLPAFRRDPRCSVVALCGTEREKTRRIANECGVGAAFGNWREMLTDGNLEGVVSSAPPGPQVEIATAALRRGLCVFAEKPLGVNPAQTLSLARLAREKQLTTMVDFEFIEMPAWGRAKDVLLERGGRREVKVEWLVESYSAKHCIDNWKSDVSKGGGALHIFGSHTLYNLEWFLGPIERLKSRLFKKPDDPRTTHTGFELDLHFKNGHHASVLVDTHSNNRFLHRWDFGGVVIENQGTDYMKNFFCFDDGVCLVEPQVTTKDDHAEDGRILAVHRMAKRFLDGVARRSVDSSGWDPAVHSSARETAAIEPGFNEGHRVQELIGLCLDSHQSGATVSALPKDLDVAQD